MFLTYFLKDPKSSFRVGKCGQYSEAAKDYNKCDFFFSNIKIDILEYLEAFFIFLRRPKGSNSCFFNNLKI